MNLPHYTDPYYESARQKRRYHTDPAYRLDRINRARKRFGLPPHPSLDYANIRRAFPVARVNVSRLRPIVGPPKRKRWKRSPRNRLTLLRSMA